MKQQLISHFRSGLVAIGLVAGLAAPALAIPISPASPAPAAEANGVIKVDTICNHRPCGNNWNGDRAFYNRNWNNNNNWRGDDRRWRRHHRRNQYVSPQIYLDLGGPSYRYVEPRRRVYRANRLTNAHVSWCYDRWRSYRAYDNTYQPLHGPRRECWSPYS